MHSNKSKTPSLAKWIATKFIDNNYLEEFFGDLQEMYEDRLLLKGRFNARAMYWIDVLHLVIGFSSPLFKTRYSNSIMIRHMFKMAWRNAIRQPQFTFLNTLGLTIGISICIVIGLYVHDEMTYDTFHIQGNRIYRVNQPYIWGDWDIQVSSTGPNVADALREDIPEFEEVTRILDMGNQIVNYNNNDNLLSFKEENYFAAEENFFDVFSFEFIQGDPKTSLKDPMSMILTQETAKRYFGYKDPIGKTLEVKHYDGTWKPYTIRGVLADVPTKSHLQFDILVSLTSYQENMQRDGWKWIWTAFSTYGLVKDGIDIQALTAKIQLLPPKWAPPTTERIFNQSYEEFTKGKPWKLTLQPLQDIYLSSEPNSHIFGPTGNPQFVNIFSAIGLLVLLLSSINFMNLSTARSSNRAKEVGIRKVLGSERKTIIKQFVFESVLFVFTSTLCALILVYFFLDVFNVIAEKQLDLVTNLTNPQFIGLLLIFILLLGIMAGSYPAFYLSSFQPIETLKGKLSKGFKGKGVRNGLVVMQFTISIALIICTFFVQKQLTYTSALDLGYAKDNILQIHNIEQLGFDTEVLKTKLSSKTAFTHVGKSFGVPPKIWSGDRYKAYGPDKPVVQLNNFRTEADYLNLLGVEFIAGRNFDETNSNDKYRVILNEEAVRVLGWGTRETYDVDSPIEKIVLFASGNEDELEVLGVVKDFNFKSVRQKIGPLIILHHQNDKTWDYGYGLSFYSLRLNPEAVKNPEDLQMVIKDVEEDLAALDPSFPFEYSFMDENFENTFRSERRMGTVLNLFTIMALVIACLGLFGLAAFSAEQRVKELGIRKVLGAKAFELVFLFLSEFTRLIFISILLAAPVSYILVNKWLSNFAYKTSIDLWVFVAAAGGALLIAIITIGYQSLTTAYTNPVESLKDE